MGTSGAPAARSVGRSEPAGAVSVAAGSPLFEALRAANLDFWARTSPADHARIGRHRERGEESFDLMFRMIGGHDRVHLGQARRTLAQVRG